MNIMTTLPSIIKLQSIFSQCGIMGWQMSMKFSTMLVKFMKKNKITHLTPTEKSQIGQVQHVHYKEHAK
jgi:hypothetical protein